MNSMGLKNNKDLKLIWVRETTRAGETKPDEQTNFAHRSSSTQPWHISRPSEIGGGFRAFPVSRSHSAACSPPLTHPSWGSEWTNVASFPPLLQEISPKENTAVRAELSGSGSHERLWSHAALSVCLWMSLRGSSRRRDECEARDESRGQGTPSSHGGLNPALCGCRRSLSHVRMTRGHTVSESLYYHFSLIEWNKTGNWGLCSSQ